MENNDFIDDSVNTFILTDDEGNEYEFELLDFVDMEETMYAVLVPVEQEGVEDDMGIVIMETVFENNEPIFTFVEDENIAQKVLNEFAARAEEDDEEDLED